MDYKTPSLPTEQRIEDLLSRMTLEEKIAQLSIFYAQDVVSDPFGADFSKLPDDCGFDDEKWKRKIGENGAGFVCGAYGTPKVANRLQKFFVEHTRLGIPGIFVGEALHGVSGPRGTIFPVPLALAATFDTGTVCQVGRCIGSEARSLGIHEILAPNLDVSREPRFGRVEETFGEDTYLCTRMGVSIIKGEQKGDISRSDAVVTEPKHFCMYAIPEGGTNCGTARVGKREVYNTFLPVFEAAFKEAGAYNVMASYNSVDGDVMMCSKEYLTQILKDELGCPGYVRSDWGGIKKIKERHKLARTDEQAICMALNNGLDVQGIDYPHEVFAATVKALVEKGKLPLERLNDSVRRVLRVKFDLGLFEHPYTEEDGWQKIVHSTAHQEVSLKAARQAMTLLKNENQVLPISKEVASIALIGPSSNDQKIGGYSSTHEDFEIPTVYQELQKALGDTVRIHQCDGCAITQGNQAFAVKGQEHLNRKAEKEIQDQIEEAVSTASRCDLILVVCGDNLETSSELHDRSELTLYGRQRELILKLARLGKPMVLVLQNGKGLDISEESRVCDAVLVSWFAGEQGARAIAETLLGRNNPAGRLPVSFPKSSTIAPYYCALPGGDNKFMEGTYGSLYPFGHGLSYTSFLYSDLQICKTSRYTFEVSFHVKNTGSVAGDEVPQLYISYYDSSIVTPDVLLKRFCRIFLCPGETKRVSFSLNYDSFKLYNIDRRWTVEPGEFRIKIGKSSQEICLEQSLFID